MTDTNRDLENAAALIRAGAVVGAPTETVYGLAGDALNDRAVARIFETKGRPQFNPLIIHVLDLAMAMRFAVFSPTAEGLARRFWPGPLTIVAPRRKEAGISLLATAGLDTIALRAPAHEIMRALIRRSGVPLAAPSANLSGALSPTSADHVRAGLGGRVAAVLDGGPSAIGVESTIVNVDGAAVSLLRPGGLARNEIEQAVGCAVHNRAPIDDVAPQSPGLMSSHYAPDAPLRLNAARVMDGEAYLGFGKYGGENDAAVALNLSRTADMSEAAANLFAFLRRLDRHVADRRLQGIAAAPIPNDGLGEAINDRLARAAAPRGAPTNPVRDGDRT